MIRTLIFAALLVVAAIAMQADATEPRSVGLATNLVGRQVRYYPDAVTPAVRGEIVAVWIDPIRLTPRYLLEIDEGKLLEVSEGFALRLFPKETKK